jgi:hypothetical protein
MSHTREYAAWKAMNGRCNSPIHKAYPYYGGRGIFVCKRWKSFENFYADMGPKPSPKHSLERLNTNGPYTPSNCTWATAKEQIRNRRKRALEVMPLDEITAELERRIARGEAL